MRRNLFSAETLYYMILSMITSVLAGLSVALVTGAELWAALAIGAGVAFVMMSQLLRMYFRKLKEVYEPLVTDDPDTFDKVFRKAWFLDLDVEI